MEKEELKKLLHDIDDRLKIMEEVRNELRRLRQVQEDKASLIPQFVESSPTVRTYGDAIRNLISPPKPHEPVSMMSRSRPPPTDDVIYIMSYFDQEMLDALVPIAKQLKIISPDKSSQSKKNQDALERICKAGAEVRLHPMLHARIFCAPQRNFLIIGSGDLQTACFGGSRFDAGIQSNYPELIKDAMKFFSKVWEESQPLTTA